MVPDGLAKAMSVHVHSQDPTIPPNLFYSAVSRSTKLYKSCYIPPGIHHYNVKISTYSSVLTDIGAKARPGSGRINGLSLWEACDEQEQQWNYARPFRTNAVSANADLYARHQLSSLSLLLSPPWLAFQSSRAQNHCS